MTSEASNPAGAQRAIAAQFKDLSARLEQLIVLSQSKTGLREINRGLSESQNEKSSSRTCGSAPASCDPPIEVGPPDSEQISSDDRDADQTKSRHHSNPPPPKPEPLPDPAGYAEDYPELTRNLSPVGPMLVRALGIPGSDNVIRGGEIRIESGFIQQLEPRLAEILSNLRDVQGPAPVGAEQTLRRGAVPKCEVSYDGEDLIFCFSDADDRVHSCDQSPVPTAVHSWFASQGGCCEARASGGRIRVIARLPIARLVVPAMTFKERGVERAILMPDIEVFEPVHLPDDGVFFRARLRRLGHRGLVYLRHTVRERDVVIAPRVSKNTAPVYVVAAI